MKIIKVPLLTALLLAVGLPPVWSDGNKSSRQPYPELGFWVTESHPNSQSTIVKYYANSNYLVSEKVEPVALDITRLSVRRFLNSQLTTELAKDSTVKTLPKLYEIN